MKCTWDHHKSLRDLDGANMGWCEKGHEYVCGPFHHRVCPECDASLRRRCGICGSEVYKCSC